MFNMIKKTSVTTLAALTLVGGLGTQAFAASEMPVNEGISIQAEQLVPSNSVALINAGDYAPLSSYTNSYGHSDFANSRRNYNEFDYTRSGYGTFKKDNFGHKPHANDSFGHSRLLNRQYNNRDFSRRRGFSSRIDADRAFENTSLIHSRF